MKKFIASFVMLTILYTTALGQCAIPNADFENWSPTPIDTNLTLDLPNDWIPVLSSIIYIFNGNEPGIQESSDAQSGSSSLQLFSDPSKIPPITVGDALSFFPCNSQEVSLNGYYKLESMTGQDTVIITYAASKFNSVGDSTEEAGIGLLNLHGNQSTWKAFSVPITYTQTPDSGTIAIIFQPTDMTNAAKLWIDNLSFGSAPPTSINEIEELDTFKFYPNPASHELTFDFRNSVFRSLQILNIHGQVVFSSNVSAKRFKVVDISSLSNGLHFIQLLDENNTITTKKFVKR